MKVGDLARELEDVLLSSLHVQIIFHHDQLGFRFCKLFKIFFFNLFIWGKRMTISIKFKIGSIYPRLLIGKINIKICS